MTGMGSQKTELTTIALCTSCSPAKNHEKQVAKEGDDGLLENQHISKLL